LVQFAGVDPTPSAVIHIPGQRVQLLDLQQAPPNAGTQLRLGQVAKQELGFEDPAQIPIGPVEAVLGGAADESLEGDRGGRVTALQRRIKLPLQSHCSAVTWGSIVLSARLTRPAS